MDISQSKLQTWRDCRNKYYYRYIMKIEKKHKPYPLMRGTIVHDMLEAHYKGKNPWKPYKEAMQQYSKLFRVEREEYGDLKGDLKLLMKGYFSHYQKDVKILKVEDELRAKITGNIHFVGKLDATAKDQGLKWLMEHKCVNTIPTGSTVPYTNLQSSSYLWLYHEVTGVKLDGVLWNYMLGKKLPKPKILASGEMSRRQTSLTWPMYKYHLQENDLDPMEYQDVKKTLDGNENTFFQRKFLPANKYLIQSVLNDTITTAKEIEKYAGKDRTRNLTRNCDFCEFKDLCRSELMGLDTKYIIKQNFKERKKDERQLQTDQ